MKNGKAIIASIFILVSGASSSLSAQCGASGYSPPANYGYGYEYRGERSNEAFYGQDRRDGSFRGEDGRYYYDRHDRDARRDREGRKEGFFGDERVERNRESRYSDRELRNRMMENESRLDRDAPARTDRTDRTTTDETK